MIRADTIAAFIANLDDPRHGTANGYTNLKCRCDRCREAWREAHRVYMRNTPEQRVRAANRSAIKTWGVPSPLLKQGWLTLPGMARALGRHPDTVEHIEPPTLVTPTGRRLYSPESASRLVERSATNDLASLLRKYDGLLTPEALARIAASMIDPSVA